MKKLFDQVSFKTSRIITNEYSTSFSIGVRCLGSSVRDAIYSIYGFVRFADEIVDTFHGYDKAYLLERFEKSYYEALRMGISLNPVLNSFQHTVKKYNIEDTLIQAFLKSMRDDLYPQNYTEKELKEYIYGSAEVVGLMCLKVFLNGDTTRYEEMKPYARRLGAAFQKINFLRDLQQDTEGLSRVYFPILRDRPLDEHSKRVILDGIYQDYDEALKGIKKLPDDSRLGVYTAYLYYRRLTELIEKTEAAQLMERRIRVSNSGKLMLLCKAYFINKLADSKW